MDRKNSGDSKHWAGRSHIKIGNDVLKSKAWAAISPMSRSLYVDLRSWMFTGANGDISATSKTLGPLGYKKSSLTKCLYELQAAGLIAKTRNGGVANGSKVCCLYRFTDMPVIAMPKKGINMSKPTHDYITLEIRVGSPKATIKEVREQIDAAMAGLKTAAKLKRPKISHPATQESTPLEHPATQDSGTTVYPISQDSEGSQKAAKRLDEYGFPRRIDEYAIKTFPTLPDKHLSTTIPNKELKRANSRKASDIGLDRLVNTRIEAMDTSVCIFRATARKIELRYRPIKKHVQRVGVLAVVGRKGGA